MGAATTIDRQINDYLLQLNLRQKKAVLTVVKTFVEEQDYDYWNDTSFVAELDRRTAEYESGNAKLYTLEELETGARKSFKEKNKDKK